MFIHNYDLESGREDVGPGESNFTGYEVDGKHYILAEEDFNSSELDPETGKLKEIEKAYELINYDPKTKIAETRVTQEKSILEKIIIEKKKEELEHDLRDIDKMIDYEFRTDSY